MEEEGASELNIYYSSVNVYIKLYNWSSKGK